MEEERRTFTVDERKAFGKKTELLFFDAFEDPAFRHPSWFFCVRKPTGLEDSEGIDAILTMYLFPDLHHVPVQIKSSAKYVYDHREKYGNRHCIVVVPHAFTKNEIRARTFEYVFKWLRKKKKKKQPPLF